MKSKGLFMPPVILLLMAACSLVPTKLDALKLIGDPDTLSHIRMLDGNTGETVVFATGEDTQAVVNFIESLNGTYDPKLGVSAGYLYWLAGYRDGEEVFRLTFGASIVKVDGKRYKLDRNVSFELDKLFNMTSYGKLLVRAMNDLAENRGVKVNEITPKSVKAHIFSDASLGVPEEGMSYAQVETPGYVLKLSVDGEIVTYHVADEHVVQVPK